MGSVSAWEAVFMLVVLKIPVVYLAGVVWWAIRAEPRVGGPGGDFAGVPASLDPCGWDEWRRRRVPSGVRRPSPRPTRPRPLVGRRSGGDAR